MTRMERRRHSRHIRRMLTAGAFFIFAVALMYALETKGHAENEKIEEVMWMPKPAPVFISPKENIEPMKFEVPETVFTESVFEPVEPEAPVVEYKKLYTEEDVIATAKMAWGEARGVGSDTKIAACIWTVPNRLDCDDPYYNTRGSLEAIVKQSGQYHGYSASNPVDEHLVELVRDVFDRWSAEKQGAVNVGRVLPAEYIYFHGNGKQNMYRIEYKSTGEYWDWSLPSPYES